MPSLDDTTQLLSDLFGYKAVAGPFDDPIQKVSVNFLAKSGNDVTEIELIAPLGENSPIQSMLKSGKGGAYHLCFETNDLERALTHAERNGCFVVSGPTPAVAFQGRRIAWICTRSRQLFELVEAKAGSL